MIILVWNTPRTENPNFLQELQKHIRTNKPHLVAPLEPRINGHNADDVCDKLGYDGIIGIEFEGFNRRVWLLWNTSSITISPQFVLSQHLIVSVKFGQESEWIFFAIYGCPVHLRR